MRILFISHYDNLYGANRALLSLMLGLKAEGRHEPLLVIPAEGEMTRRLSAAGIEYFICGITQWQAIYREPLSFTIKKNKRLKQIEAELEILYEHFKGKNIDLIHSNSSVIGHGAMLAEKLGCKHIWHIREFAREHYGMRYFYPQDVVDKYYNAAERLILISDALKAHYDKLYPNAKKVRIYDGVEIPAESDLSGGNVAAEEGGNNESDKKDCIFIYTGYLFPKKRQLDVLKAALELKKNGVKDFHVILAGNGDAAYTKELEGFIKSYDLKEAELKGFVEDVPALLKQCDVGVIASEYEGFGLVTVEYMLNSMPVIGYRSGATPEIVEDGRTGLLYDNVNGLAEAMEKLIKDKQLRNSLGSAGSERAVNNFSATANVKAVQKLLDETDG
jgi:glycosyltransferase involved in cell wall biosynthesis